MALNELVHWYWYVFWNSPVGKEVTAEVFHAARQRSVGLQSIPRSRSPVLRYPRSRLQTCYPGSEVYKRTVTPCVGCLSALGTPRGNLYVFGYMYRRMSLALYGRMHHAPPTKASPTHPPAHCHKTALPQTNTRPPRQHCSRNSLKILGLV